jgi:hypothetical protein
MQLFCRRGIAYYSAHPYAGPWQLPAVWHDAASIRRKDSIPMISRLRLLALPALLIGTLTNISRADDSAAEKYDLKYKFRPGETVRWKVEHQAKIRTTVSGTSQTAETESQSVKVWTIKQIGATTGNIEFIHSVDSILMKQRLSGRQEEVYDSTKDSEPPLAFQDVAKSVRVPLSEVRIDPRGRVMERINHSSQAGGNDSQIAVLLPENPVAIGDTWSLPSEVELRQDSGMVKKIQTKQQFTLEAVSNGVAVIRTETIILTPVRDPALEAQLIQRQSAGTIRFDIERGRVMSQELKQDKQVVGFRGETSALNYEARFTETLITDGEVASRPKLGPEPPPGLKLRR